MFKEEKSFDKKLPKESNEMLYDENYLYCVAYMEEFFRCSGSRISLTMPLYRRNKSSFRYEAGKFNIRNIQGNIFLSYNIFNKHVDVEYKSFFLTKKTSKNLCIALFNANNLINEENESSTYKYEIEKPTFLNKFLN